MKEDEPCINGGFVLFFRRVYEKKQKDMKRTLILGASGTLGKALVGKLRCSGERALTLASRHAKEHFSECEKCRVMDCDATKADSLLAAMEDCDTVFCAVSGEGLPIVAKNIVAAMNAKSITRLVFMGAVGIYNEIPVNLDDEDNVRNNSDQIPNRDAVTIVEESDLNYTVIRPGYLKEEGAADDFVLTFKGEQAKGYESTLSSVVDLIVELIDNPSLYSRQSVCITKDMS